MKKNLFIATALLTTVMSFNAFAGEWYQQGEDWYYTDTSEHWVKSGEDWYYVDDAGKMMKNYVTPDGYYCSFSGRIVHPYMGEDGSVDNDSSYGRGQNAVYAFYVFGDATAMNNLPDEELKNAASTNMGFLSNRFSPHDKKLVDETVWGYNQVDTLKYVQSVLDPIAEEAAKLPEYERAGFLYDKVVDMLDYDYPEYKSSEEVKADGGRDLNGACTHIRDVGPTILAKKGLCLEYSNVYKRLCNLAGLDCAVINNGTHSWNVVKINGKLYYFDTSAYDCGTTDRKYAETDKPWDFRQSDEYIKRMEELGNNPVDTSDWVFNPEPLAVTMGWVD